MNTEGDVVGFNRDGLGRFSGTARTKQQDKGKAGRTLNAQKKALRGSRKTGSGRAAKVRAGAGSLVTNRQQKNAIAKTRRKANGG